MIAVIEVNKDTVLNTDHMISSTGINYPKIEFMTWIIK
jgi:hypothetical protein